MTKQHSKSGAATRFDSVLARIRKQIAPGLPLFRKNYTYISEQVSFYGDLSAVENVNLDGWMHGNIRAAKQVSLGPTACFEGNIECESAIISGKVTGCIRTSKTITVCVSATIDGDLISNSVKIESGAVVNGTIASQTEDTRWEPFVTTPDRDETIKHLVEPIETR